MKTFLLWTLVMTLAAAGVYGAIKWRSGRDAGDGTAYRTVPIRRTDLIATITATGTVVPEDVVDVGAQVNGLIASFGKDRDGQIVDYRSVVDADMVLARIDDTLYAADVATADAQLVQAQAQVRVAEASRDQAKARLEQTRRDWARAQKLGQSRALSQADFDAAESGHEQAQASQALAEASIGQAKAQVAIAQAALLRSRRNLAFCTIKSPVNGVIIDRRVEIGQTVVASLNAPSLFLIAKDLARMKVLVQVNEADIGHVRPGQPVTYGVDALQDETFAGEVRKVRLNASMTQNVVTYTVEIVADNAELKLLPYLTASVRFELARREDVLAVPGAATRWSPPGRGPAADTAGGAPESGPRPQGGRTRARATTLWVLADGILNPIDVRTGLSDGSLVEVEGEGLREGDLVVLGELSAPEQPTSEGTSPFAPPPRRGGGRR